MKPDQTAAVPLGFLAESSVAHRFQTAAGDFGDRIAVRVDSDQLTYGELLDRASRVASVLAQLGLKPGDRCAFLANRSLDAVVLICAILRLGAAYVPLDPLYPRAQLDFMLADCDPQLLIADASALASVGGLSGTVHDLAVLVDRSLTAGPIPLGPIDGDSPAYVMYTSGSTGRPKGVIVPHRAIVRLVTDQTFATLTPETRFLHLAPLAFDASTLEIWGPLLNGGTMVIIPDAYPTFERIGATIGQFDVTSAWFTAGLFNALVDQKIDAFAPLREVIAGGDVLSPSHVARLLAAYPTLQVVNGYGPTENTTFTCCYRVPRHWVGPEENTTIPIGYPLVHTQVFIVDDNLRLVPDGETGELLTGGAGLALGYLNRPELTAEKFVTASFAGNNRVYRTGDLVRRRADGAIEFLGRSDRQVKISGKRVELDEIEHAVRSAPGVADAVVSAIEVGGLKRVGAAIKPLLPEADLVPFEAQISAHLKSVLPEHMMPGVVKVLAEFPLTANGKVDRRSLTDQLVAAVPAPSALRTGTTQSGTLQERLAAAFELALGYGPLDRKASFFDLGIRSLDLMKIHARVQADINPSVSLLDLFTYPSIDALSSHLSAPSKDVAAILQTQSGRRNAALAQARAARGRRTSSARE